MKYVMLGTIDSRWVGKHAERSAQARSKFKELGIELETVYYTQGPFEFVDIIEAPDPEAA
jgi:uncharacterized protein with GYD domain